MVRVVIALVIVAVALWLFAIVDAAMTEANRTRGVSKPVWVLLVVFLPVVGSILWLVIGKVRDENTSAGTGSVPPEPAGPAANAAYEASDARMRELEERLRELDAEIYDFDKQKNFKDQQTTDSLKADKNSAAPETKPQTEENREQKSNNNGADEINDD